MGLKKTKSEIELHCTGKPKPLKTVHSINYCTNSLDCMEWKLLPTVDDGLRVKSTLISGRFTGDPDHMAEHRVIKRLGDDEGMEESASTVNQTDHHVCVIISH